MPSAKCIGLSEVYIRLLEFYGPQHWWPADTVLEIIIGAILVQGTNWRNAEKAISDLKKNNLLDVISLRNVDLSKLAKIIRSSGFQRVKASRIKNFIHRLCSDFQCNLDRLKTLPTARLRKWLLSIKGIGRETADNIILYAFNRSVFPVDKYTRRLFRRLGIIEFNDYEEIRRYVESKITRLDILKEFRALIVVHCKNTCKTQPICRECPLEKMCHYRITK